MHWFGQECDFYALAIDALGPSLEDLINYCGRGFSLKTILLIADQAISPHSAGCTGLNERDWHVVYRAGASRANASRGNAPPWR